MASINLTQAKNAKVDEFYTLWEVIEREVQAYLEYDPDVFRGKTILLPCDDPEWSNFTKFFALHFQEYGLKKLISTSYAPESKAYKTHYQTTLFEENSPKFDKDKTKINGKIFTLCEDSNSDGKIDIDDLRWDYLGGNGDFRSKEVLKLRDEADIIITNPPFSLFPEFFAWITDASKHFLIIGNMNAITYKEVFPHIKGNSIWLGATNFNKGMYFRVPADFVYADSYKFEKEIMGEKVNRVPGVCWFTNIDHGRHHQPLPLMPYADNLKFSKHKEIRGKTSYEEYDNYGAIEVPYADAIPSDYDGVMGVPISFLDKYCPDQFEIMGATESEGRGFSCGLWDENSKISQPLIKGKRIYKRIFIRKKRQ
ncbi:MAG: adenine-specific methyltransferase EcoRI family protein [Methanomassiliicoccaceae archaeon]|nr:adenine-specific methyltransferase EcoRI family protein [Methanomassiliicoccaceae archaeon]